MKLQLSFITTCSLLAVFCLITAIFPAALLAKSMLLMSIPPTIAATSPMARLIRYGSQQQCLWGEGEVCEKEYDKCIKKMNDLATELEQDCYQRLSSCTSQCGGQQVCINICITKFNTCTKAAQMLLSSKQRECNAQLEQCYTEAIDACIDIPASLTELFPRWYLAR